jgi:hypothetical protein
MTVNLNLETLKLEMLAYLESSGLAVFHGVPGGLEGMPLVLWDVERYPDYRMFFDAARNAGVKLVVFAAAEFLPADLDDLEEHLEEGAFARDEKREFQARIRELRIHEGVTCSIELAFNLDSRMYVYDLQPDWYDEFANLEEEILSQISEDESDEDDSLGGYYSKN